MPNSCKKLLIVGAGGHGRVVADAAYCSDLWNEISFVDDRYPDLSVSGQYAVIGNLSDLGNLVENWPDAIVAVGKNQFRLDLQSRLTSLGYRIATIVHPTAQVARDVLVGSGSVLFANSVVNTGSSLGNAVILNTSATIDHDGEVGDGVHLSPGVHLAGNVTIGDCSWLGIGASVVNDLAVGADVIVGAGAVVIQDVPDDVTVAGVPAKLIQ